VARILAAGAAVLVGCFVLSVGATPASAGPTPPPPVTGPNPVDVTGQGSGTAVPIWGYPWPVVGVAPAPNTVEQSAGVAVASPAPAPAPTSAPTPAAPTLARTGPLQATPWLIGIGVILVDLGYVALSATRRGRPFRSFVWAVLDGV
jgi:hypothetical protein